ncbi:MAG: TssN family type VI secretion system protein [Bacteroidota bacterium]|nr:TssN family type VI secretion system protein [Bacteroidota bacterium]
MADDRITKKYGKRSFLYALILVILLGLISLLQWSETSQADSYYYFGQALVLCLGAGHVLLMYKFVPPISPDDFRKGLLFTLLLMLAAALAAAVLYYFILLDYRFLTYILPFVIPYLCWQACRFFFQIPSRTYKSWYYPLNEEMPDLDMIDLSQIEVVQFVFFKNPQDTTQTNFTSKAPLNMTLGQLFFIFINDYNDKNVQNPISYLKSSGQPYGWLFYRKKKWLGQQHFFDADLSFRDNSIQPNEFIYAVRVD